MSTKAELVQQLHEAGKGAPSKLNRKTLAELTEMAAPADPRVTLLHDTLAELSLTATEDVQEKKSYSRVRAVSEAGTRWTVYLNKKNIEAVAVGLKGDDRKAALDRLAALAEDARVAGTAVRLDR